MSNAMSNEGIVNRLASQAAAVGRLAQDSGAFAATVAAFESQDPEAFRWVLDRSEMLPYCELICEWVRVKICVLRCIRLCGPPIEKEPTPSLEQFARAIVKLASNEKLLRKVVDAVSCGEADDYRAAIAELELGPYCHLLCHWVCGIIYRRVCERVCTPILGPFTDVVGEIRDAAKVMAKVLEQKKAFPSINKAAEALDCVTLQSAVEQAGFSDDCQIICCVICVWRCVWVCREICPVVDQPFAVPYDIEEARAFALAAKQLAQEPRGIGDLVAAAVKRDAKAYRQLIARYGLGPYCLQVCGWICWQICYEFCICVCPPQLYPWFTAIGGYDYLGQVDSALPATGLTNGETRAFFSTLRLNGILTQALGGQPMEYRFEYQPITVVTTKLAAAITASPLDTSINVTGSVGFPAAPFNAVIGSANGSYEIVTVTAGPPGIAWTVVRAQKGTAPLAAAAGATITTGAAAAGAWTPVPEAWVAPTQIGKLEVGLPPFSEYWVGTPISPPGPPPPPVLPVSVVGGWIQVPQGPNVFLSGDMINLMSTSLPSFPAADETGVSAGNPANHPLPTDHCFGLRMRVRQVGLPLTETDGGTCTVAAIDNTLYNNINRHPDWDGGVVSSQYAVVMVDIRELQSENTTIAAASNGQTLPQATINVVSTAGFPSSGTIAVVTTAGTVPVNYTGITPISFTGCTGGTGTMSTGGFVNACADVSDSLTVLFTASHPNLGPVSLRMDGPGGPYSFTLPTPIPETGDWYGTAINGFTLADLIPCAYLVTLSVTPLLTTGDVNIQTFYDQIAFCKTS